MSYETRRRIPPDAIIDIDDPAELAKWAHWLGVPDEEVVRAVEAVGPFAAAVRDYLGEEE